MIAIAVVAVMSNGTSNAQTALETTLAREEIDSQAEALRFIHSSYIANSSDPNSPYLALWNAIKSQAHSSADEGLTQYAPSSCEELYDSNNLVDQNAFIVNLNAIGDYTKGISSAPESVIITANNDSDKFYPASTYPRLVYNRIDDDSDDAHGLLDDTTSLNTSLERTEGIYIVAVQDNQRTTIVDDSGHINNNGVAYYDFYIRTCWYGAGANDPSTISTLIRLYNPDLISG